MANNKRRQKPKPLSRKRRPKKADNFYRYTYKEEQHNLQEPDDGK